MRGSSLTETPRAVRPWVHTPGRSPDLARRERLVGQPAKPPVRASAPIFAAATGTEANTTTFSKAVAYVLAASATSLAGCLELMKEKRTPVAASPRLRGSSAISGKTLLIVRLARA